MEAYLEALDLQEVIEENSDVSPLPDNPTMTQTKIHKDRKTKKAKANVTLFVVVFVKTDLSNHLNHKGI